MDVYKWLSLMQSGKQMQTTTYHATMVKNAIRHQTGNCVEHHSCPHYMLKQPKSR